MIDAGLFIDVLRSEWTKLRSVRSTYWSALASLAFGIGLSAALSAATASQYDSLSIHDKLTFDATSDSLNGIFFAQLALGVLAVMAMSSEYSTGTIRTTVSAVPQRGYVLAAKATILAVMGTLIGLVITFSSFFIGQAIFSSHHINVPLSHPGTLRAVVGGGLYIGGIALFALGLASVIRHTAGAITALAGIVFILPPVTFALPDNWQHNFARYLPANAGGSIANVIIDPTSNLTPWVGFGVFLLWCAALLGAGWYLLRSRDV